MTNRLTSTIVVNDELRKRVRDSVREALGARRRVEIGLRRMTPESPELTPNEHLWHEDADLEDIVELPELKMIQVAPDGRVALDLYCYKRAPYWGQELDTNLTCKMHVADVNGRLYITKFEVG